MSLDLIMPFLQPIADLIDTTLTVSRVLTAQDVADSPDFTGAEYASFRTLVSLMARATAAAWRGSAPARNPPPSSLRNTFGDFACDDHSATSSSVESVGIRS